MKKSLLVALMLAATALSVFAADIAVPYLALLTDGRVNDVGAFILSTRASIDILVEGGDKFDAWFKLGFRNAAMEGYLKSATPGVPTSSDASLEDLAAAVARLEEASGLSLRTIAVQTKGIFGSSLELAAFVGHLDTFCSGADFPAAFGTRDFSTRFKGYMYYPSGIGGDRSRSYDGLHEVYGTGLRLSLPGESIRPALYVYQDSWLGAGRYSADLRTLLSLGPVRLEAFAGASFPVSTLGAYRAGLLFLFEAGNVGEFYAQIGVPYWDPTQAVTMDLFYFMFEPRVKFGAGELVISLFFHPAIYLQKATNESGAIELRFDIGFGAISEGSMRFGAETLLAYDPNLSAATLRLDAAPYLEFIRNGVRWDLRLALRAFPFPNPWYGIFMPMVGISTAY